MPDTHEDYKRYLLMVLSGAAATCRQRAERRLPDAAQLLIARANALDAFSECVSSTQASDPDLEPYLKIAERADESEVLDDVLGMFEGGLVTTYRESLPNDLRSFLEEQLKNYQRIVDMAAKFKRQGKI